jgi:hypothetical protein
MAGRPRLYDRRVPVTTNIEADLYSFGKDELFIPANEAITLGYIGMIDSELSVRKNISEPDLDRYLEIRNRVFKSNVLEKERDLDAAHRTADFSNDIRESATKPEPDQTEIERLSQIIKVYDAFDEKRCEITVRKYESEKWRYQLLIPSEPDTGDDLE